MDSQEHGVLFGFSRLAPIFEKMELLFQNDVILANVWRSIVWTVLTLDKMAMRIFNPRSVIKNVVFGICRE